MSAKLALNRYLTRQMRQNKPRQKRGKNDSPEKHVEKEVIRWLESSGFDVSVVESKAVYSPTAGRYLRGQTEPGFSDVAGVTPDGYGCFVELKAPGKKKTIRPAQVDFLLRKIRRGAFCCCVDSVDDLANTYRVWVVLKKQNDHEAIEYLIKILPKSHLEKTQNNDELW